MIRKFIHNHVTERLVGKQFAQPFWDKPNALSLRGMNIGNSGTLNESGELWVIRNLFKQLPRNVQPVIFDVGANVGDYASEVLLQRPDSQLYCFEPSRKTFELLSERLAQQPNVRLFNFGFGEKEERITLYSDAEASGLASVYSRRLDHLNVKMDRTEEVLLKTLDEFCCSQNISHVNLVKIDVEGHELKVLEGARELINSQSINLIQFEFGGTDIDSKTFIQDFFYLLDQSYRICRIVRDGVVPLGPYQERFEIFLYSNFLAVSEKTYAAFVAA